MRLSKKTALHGDREWHQPPELQMLQVAQADLGTHCVTQVELLIFLPLSPECWDCRTMLGSVSLLDCPLDISLDTKVFASLSVSNELIKPNLL